MDRTKYLRDVRSRGQDGGVREITRKQASSTERIKR